MTRSLATHGSAAPALTQSVVRLLFVYQNLYQLEAIARVVVAAKRRSETFVNECALFWEAWSSREDQGGELNPNFL